MNILPSTKLQNHSPHCLLFGKPPDFSHLRVFGSLWFASTLIAYKTKFQPRARKCVLLGHKESVKGYLLYDLLTNEIFLSRNVVFYETIFPLPKSDANIPTDLISNPCLPYITSTDDLHSSNTVAPSPTQLAMLAQSQPQVLSDQFQSQPPSTTNNGTSNITNYPPSYLRDYHCNTIMQHQCVNQASGTLYPLSNFLSYHKISPAHTTFLVSLTSHTEPKTYKQAYQHEHWILAMDQEIAALEQNQTWVLIELPLRKQTIGCK